ncbi:hypothetical protein AGATL06_10440 [Agathobaculum sp. TL06]
MGFKKAKIAGLGLLAAALAVLLYTVLRHDWPAWETPWTIGGALLLAAAGAVVLLAGYRCPYCGKGLKFGARYCTHCGSLLEDCGRIRQDCEPPASAKLLRSHVWAARLRWALSVPVFLALACSPYAAWERPALAVLIGGYLLAEAGIACLWMRCPHCGKPLDGGEAHCPRCGGRLER